MYFYKFVLLLSLSVFLVFGFGRASNQVDFEHNKDLLKKLRTAVFSKAENVVIQLQEEYCPYDLREEGLEYRQEKSSSHKVTFKFLEWSSFAYCNDSIPAYCLVSIIKENQVWNVEDAVIHCVDHWGQ